MRRRIAPAGSYRNQGWGQETMRARIAGGTDADSYRLGRTLKRERPLSHQLSENGASALRSTKRDVAKQPVSPTPRCTPS